MRTRRRARRRRRKRVAGDITLSRPDGVQISVVYSDTDTVIAVKKRIHALTGNWYNICSVSTAGDAPAVCAGANKHNSLYRTLTAAGVAPRAGHELLLVPASGPGGASPYRSVTQKRFSYLPGTSKSKSKSNRKSKRKSNLLVGEHKDERSASTQLPSTTDQNTVNTLRVLLVQLEDEALRLEASGMDNDITTLRLRQLREGDPDENEIAEVRSNGFRDVRRKLNAKLRALLRHGRLEDDHLRRPMLMPGSHVRVRWPGGRLDNRSYRMWHRAMSEYLEQGERDLMDLSPADEENWRWSSYLRNLNNSL